MRCETGRPMLMTHRRTPLLLSFSRRHLHQPILMALYHHLRPQHLLHLPERYLARHRHRSASLGSPHLLQRRPYSSHCDPRCSPRRQDDRVVICHRLRLVPRPGSHQEIDSEEDQGHDTGRDDDEKLGLPAGFADYPLGNHSLRRVDTNGCFGFDGHRCVDVLHNRIGRDGLSEAEVR